MNRENAETIIILCSHLCVGEGMQPFSPAEWSLLAQRLHRENRQPFNLLEYTAEELKNKLSFTPPEIQRIQRLVSRSASLAFERERLNNMGIHIVTRAEQGYPLRIKKNLGKGCPPLFYYAGDLSLANTELLGFVGSRNVRPEDMDFTAALVERGVQKGYGIVSGGARGVDTIASSKALESGGIAVEFLAEGLEKKLMSGSAIGAIRKNRLLLLTSAKPDAGFSAGMAMARNRYIYAASIGTVAVKADLNKGGTWTGAAENLRHHWCPVFCWNNTAYKGNGELIRKGAIPIDADWDLDIGTALASRQPEEGGIEQLSLL